MSNHTMNMDQARDYLRLRLTREVYRQHAAQAVATAPDMSPERKDRVANIYRLGGGQHV